MRGFLVGSLALIVSYVLLQPGAAGAATAGGNVLVAGLRRVLSDSVAGVPQRKTSTHTTAAPSTSPPAAVTVAQPAGVTPTTGTLTLT